jgi:regulator of sigma E protease
LGIAYRVENTVASVAPGSPAAKAGILPNDQIDEVRLRDDGKKIDSPVEWSSWVRIAYPDNKDSEAWGWAYFFANLQARDYHEVEVRVKRGNAVQPAVEMKAEPDPTWPLANRGLLLLLSDTRLEKADTLLEAMRLGGRDTIRFIKTIYLTLSRLLSGRISATKSLGGPIKIAEQAFTAADDSYAFILFLGAISVNLAVINFLPIPVLDGGHMVFLVYEKLRGRRPSETVQTVATFVGLALILLLVIFASALDIRGLFPKAWKYFFG